MTKGKKNILVIKNYQNSCINHLVGYKYFDSVFDARLFIEEKQKELTDTNTPFISFYIINLENIEELQ